MRERLAKLVAAALTGLVLVMAAFFADRRNQPEGSAEASAPIVALPDQSAGPSDPALADRGRAVFEAQACARCHAVEGRGNPRSPLDGVGARRPPADLIAWATGTGPAREVLPRSTLRAKEDFTRLPEADLEALTAFLASLR